MACTTAAFSCVGPKVARHFNVQRGAAACSSLPSLSRRPIAYQTRNLVVRAAPETQEETAASVDVDALVKDLQTKWDAVENKTSVAVYGIGAFVLIWLSSTVVNAVNAVPLLPKFLELVGLGYSAWFVYRYLLFKSSREELIDDIEELKKKISGESK